MGRFEETLEILAGKGDSVVVAYSGGKESSATLDLCLRAFKHVEAYFMYLIPGLECAEAALEAATKRWGVPIRQYPHPILRDYLMDGRFCFSHWSKNDLPKWSVGDVHRLVMADTEIRLIATGEKRTDSVQRRKRLDAVAAKGNQDYVIRPLLNWTKFDILAYLKVRGIPLPQSSGRMTTGIDLTTPELLFMHDTFPKDFERIEEVFPFVRAVVKRREWYGVTT